MGDFDEFTGDEPGHEPVSLSVGRIVIDENVIGMLSSLREALQRFFVRLRNCV